MPTIKCYAISAPTKTFKCKVLRAEVFNVIKIPERWEEWNVLAENIEGARKVAEYHFYRSNPDNIIINA